jgi:hypothetical protein
MKPRQNIACCQDPDHGCDHGWSAAAPPFHPARRSFLQRASLATGIALLGAASPGGPSRAAGLTDVLLLTCMDFRLMDNVEHYMSGRGLTDRYDHVILAGASLGALTDKYPAWNRTFWDHLDLAIKLHGIHTVMVIDHRDCGAYKAILGEDLAADPTREHRVHQEHLVRLSGAIREKYPNVKVQLLLLALDGSVESVGEPA